MGAEKVVKTRISILISVFFAVSAMGCGNTAGSNSATSNAQDTASNLVGTWNLATCQSAGPLTGAYLTDSVTFTATSMTETEKTFTDSACQNLAETTVATATYSVGATMSSTVVGFAIYGNDINFTFTDITITPNTSTAASNYNSKGTNGFCGLQIWASGTAVDVTGKTDTSSSCSFPASGTLSYQIFTLGTGSGNTFSPGTSPVNAVEFGNGSTNSQMDPDLVIWNGDASASQAPTAFGNLFFSK